MCRLKTFSMRKKFVSYAQNLEDVMLYRIFSDVDRGFYVDIGACDPVQDSVTHAFYNRGWSGINVEPHPDFFKRLERYRTRDINIEKLVSREAGTLDFVQIDGSGISSVENRVLDRAKSLGFKLSKTRKEAITLQAIEQQHCLGRTVHFLKIDVEGHEADVIAGADWKNFRPLVLIVEAVVEMEHPQLPSATPAWDAALLQAGYLFAWFDGLNRFYVRQESPELMRHFDRPVNVLDYFELAKGHSWTLRSSVMRRSILRLLSPRAKAWIRASRARLFGAKLG
jgi:FkbM family methyltransferase